MTLESQLSTQQDTPMLRQYKLLKEQALDAILFFRLGDFYEMFLEDAKVAARELELTLTGRGKDDNRIPMCGFPYHAAENYIPRLIAKGYKVAICEQVEDASAQKGLTRREIVRVITPGILQGEGILEESENNFLLGIYPHNKGFGTAFLDITTGEFNCLDCLSYTDLLALLNRLNCKEVVIPFETSLQLPDGIVITTRPFVDHARAESCLKTHFKIQSLGAFGLHNAESCYPAAWALLSYVQDTQKGIPLQLNRLTQLHQETHLHLDRVTVKNLELTEALHNANPKGTLFWVLNHCKTAMGSRRLKSELTRPSTQATWLNERLDAVETLKNDLLSREEIRDLLNQVYDLERLSSRIASSHHNPRDMMALKLSLQALRDLPGILMQLSGNLLSQKAVFLMDFFKPESAGNKLIALIDSALLESPPPTIREGNLFKAGYDTSLDDLVQTFKSVKDWIGTLEPLEREQTGIKSLKVGYTKVFGYYLEIPQSQQDKVPPHYIRKQTLSNAERFITPELKEKEAILLHGEEKQVHLEKQLYEALVEKVLLDLPALQEISRHLAELDVIQSLATAAQKYTYSRPRFSEVDSDQILKIEKGRHPVLERNQDLHFVSNSLELSPDQGSFMLLTGPNMAGKSTLMRQVALLVVMAQIGSFVPAQAMELSLVDRLYTRIGALDNLYAGQSTYMVEMVETAAILNTATSKSLIILDEIGRGTATYDGMSIAWAVTEYIHDTLGARTLFATHYHELTQLEQSLKGLRNYSMKITESQGKIIFQHLLIPGPADKSYGIHVAELAGLPTSVIEKATVLLADFEAKSQAQFQRNSAQQMRLF